MYIYRQYRIDTYDPVMILFLKMSEKDLVCEIAVPNMLLNY